MDRRSPPYDHLSRDRLIDLVVEQAARIEQLEARNRGLGAQNRALTARVAELEAENRTLRAWMAELESQVRQLLEKLGNPATPKNSSLPPSQGKKPDRPDAKTRPDRGGPGFSSARCTRTRTRA